MFAASGLLTAAEARFGAVRLKNRVAPDADGDDAAKTAELLKIAASVIGSVQSAAQESVGWPLPGVWPSDFVSPIDGSAQMAGATYEDFWPYELFQKALDLFDFRTYSAREVVPSEKVKIGQAAEAWLRAVARGTQGLGISTDTDVSVPEPLSARNRQGVNLSADGGADNDRVIDTFVGGGWDFLL